MKWVADTSWVYAFFDAADEHHQKARLEAEEPSTLHIHITTLVETLNLCRKRFGRQASLVVLASLEAMPQVRFSSATKTANLARAIARHGSLSWSDAAAICTALDEGAGLRTFDANQRKAFQALA